MKNFVWVVLIGFASGMAGAFFYTSLLLEEDRPASEGQLVSTQQNPSTFTHYETLHRDDVQEKQDQARLPQVLNEDFVYASKASTPSVVYIKTLSQTRYASTWMDYFFGERSGQSISSGSGVIFTTDGYIVSNNHVIQNADNIEVMIGKQPYAATLVGSDPSTDLAVLKIEADDLPAIRLGNSQDVHVGEWVLAVGNPFNLTSTVTAGIVSAKGRELNILKSNFPIESFIQTDAAINPGNSGGALVNLDGQLIGINTAILSETGSYAGYGFAVPAEIVKKVVNDIIAYGEVQKAFIGANILDIDAEIAKKLALKSFRGVVVSYVQDDGAAASAGLQRGDVVLKIDNTPVNSRSEFEELLSYHSPGDRINISYMRDGKPHTTLITLTNREGTTKLLRKEIITSRTLGADFERVSKVERDLLNISNGVRVVKVRNGFIGQMNLEEGFIVTAINQIAINTPEDLIDILTKIRGRVIVEGVNKRGSKEYYRYYF